jgi:hypothetical protein
VKGQRCLYCDRPLDLLSRIRGDGEFCSREHRRIYQKEHSQLALQRLLQAQPMNSAGARKAREQRHSAGALRQVVVPPIDDVVSEATPSEAGVLVEEILPDPAVLEESLPEGALAEQTAPESSAAESTAPESVVAESAVNEPAKTPVMAGFLAMAIAEAEDTGGARGTDDSAPSWNPLPVHSGNGAGPAPGIESFVVPGAFIRRQIQPIAPTASTVQERLQALVSPVAGPQMRYLEDRLQRTERIGFCPP